jgi:hypothetical protein
VTSTKYWLTLTSATPSATIGLDTMDIGLAADAVSPWKRLRADEGVFSVGIGCSISGSPTYTVQHCYDEVGTAYNHATIAAKTEQFDGSYTAPVAAIRLLWTAAGTVTLTAIQATSRE